MIPSRNAYIFSVRRAIGRAWQGWGGLASSRTFLGPFAFALSFSGCFQGRVPLVLRPIGVTELREVSYDQKVAKLLLKGRLQAFDARPLAQVVFYGNASCSEPVLGQGVAAKLESEGLRIEVPSSGKTSIYARMTTRSDCSFVIDYDPLHSPPPAPVFTTSLPVSPSRVTASPTLFGEARGVTASLRFFDDVACTNSVGEGTAAQLETQGIRVELPPNQLSSVFVRAYEPFGNASDCSLFTTFEHDGTISANPTLTSVTPPTPNNLSTEPVFRGELSVETVKVALYSDPGCTVKLAEANKEDFATVGATLRVDPNSSTPIYAVAENAYGGTSICKFLVNYVHDTVRPMAPVFESITPINPNSEQMTLYPKIKGAAPSDAAQVLFYDSETCAQQIGLGTRAIFQADGIPVNAKPNDVTSIYAVSRDAAGNSSSCTFMATYVHDTLPPDDLIFTFFNPVSPNNLSTSPKVGGGASLDTVEVRLYSSSDCAASNLIGAGSGADFNGTGITASLFANTTTSVYGVAQDAVGNTTTCRFLSNYAHSDQPAVPPGFLRTSPLSPSRNSFKPRVIGTADSSLTEVLVYGDAACTQLLGRDRRAVFAGSGIQLTLPQNETSSLYGQSINFYGNTSPCTYLSDFTHDTVPPAAPNFSGFDVVTPNSQLFRPRMRGSASGDTARVVVYDSDSCGTAIGSGTKQEFENEGVLVEGFENAILDLHAQAFDAAGNPSPCKSMAVYQHDNIPPGLPSFVSAAPMTSRRTSYRRTLSIAGTATTDTVNVRIYNDPACEQSIAQGARDQFLGAGIAIIPSRNTAESYYARALDHLDNASACRKLLDFEHSDLGPANLQASLQPNGRVQLTWTADLNAATYVVKRSESSGGPYQVLSEATQEEGFVDRATRAGVQYFYVVQGRNLTGRSLDSAEATVSVALAPPATPSSLVATPGDRRVELSWSPQGSASSYSVWRSTSPGGPYALALGNLFESLAVDRSVTNGVTYFYVVQSSNPAGPSSFSAEVAVTPLALPSAPVGLTLVAGSDYSVHLSWVPPPYFKFFRVFRQGASLETTSTSISEQISPYDSSSLSSDTYEWRVSAAWGNSESDASEAVSLVVRASPVVSVFPGDGLLRLAWSSDEFAKSYVVERALSPSGPFSTIAQGVELQGYDDVGLSNGTAYFYRVRTLFTNEVYGFPSTVVSGIPAVSAGAPSNLVVTGTTSAQLSWTAPSNYSAFQVFRASTSNGTYSLVGTSSLPSFTHNLTSDGVGHYRVRAVWDGVNSTFSNTAVFRRAQVVGVNASGSTSPLRVTVSWTAYTGASSYEVRRAASANGTYSTIAANAAGSSYIDTAVALGNSYYYRVIPKFSDGTRGRDSDFAVGRVDTTTQPTGLSVLGWTTTSVTLTWPTVSGSISSYKVFRRLSGGSYSSALATVPQSASRLTTTLNSGFAGGVGYAFVVRAVSNTGVESANSNEVFVQMVSSPTWVAVIPGHNRVDLSWTSMTGASFRVLRSEDGVNFTELVTGYAGSIYADTSVVNGRQYFYLVEATYTGMPGFVVSTPLSSGVTPGVVPLTPGGLAATVAASGATVDLSWAPVSGATGYQVLYGTSPGGPHPLVSAVMPGTSTSISELTDGTPYYFVVRALLGTVPSAGVSNEVAAVPMSTPAAPTVRAQADAQASVLVSWAPVSAGGVAPQSYRLERSSDGVAFSLLASGITGTSQVDATVNLSTRYEYRYQPVFTGGVLGGYSAASVGVVPGTRPETPAQLRARAGAATAVELTWAPVTNVEGYSIERATAAAGPYAEVTYVTGVGTTVHTDTSVSEGVTYFYRIRSRNSDGVLSFASAVVGVSLVGAPQNLAATVSDGKIALSWDALAGASGYLVSRAKSLDGSYERFSPVASPGLEDTAVEDGVTYLYRVTGVFADGSVSRDSAAVSAQAVSRFDLQVPIELTDQPLASLGAPITFDRTRTVIEPAAYDGSVTYYFEAVATNTDSVSRQAQVVDPEGGVLATLTFPSGTPTPTRLRVPFTGALAQKIPLRVALEATPSDALLMLYSARVLVQQVGATRTKLYFPLLSSGTAVAAGDATAPIVATSQAQAESLAFGATLYRRLLEHQSPLREVNPWELEAVVATSGGAIGNLALRDHISGATVAASAVEAAGTALRVAGAQFADGVEGFGGTEEGRDFELSAFCLSDCDLGAVQIYKAGLWMALRSLSKVEVPFRSTLAGVVPGPAAASVLDAWRVFPDLSAFSAPAGGAPELFFQAVGAVVSEPDSATVDLVGWGSADQAGTATPVAGSSLSFNSDDLTWARVAGALPAPAGERYSTRIAPGVGAVDLRDATVVIRARK